jgi:hypothetical protein
MGINLQQMNRSEIIEFLRSLQFFFKISRIVGGWIKKGGAISDRSRTHALGHFV